MTEEELIELEKQEFETGPLSVLLNAVKNNTQVSFQNFCDLFSHSFTRALVVAVGASIRS